MLQAALCATEAFKAVTQRQEQIDTLKKLDERIVTRTQEVIKEEEETTTTNGIF